MGIYSIRVQYDRSLLVGKCVNGLEQRTTVAPANFIGYRISSFKFPLGLIVSVSFSAQYCQSHLWYRTGWDNECKAPPSLFLGVFLDDKLLFNNNREEKSLRHVAMVATFLDENKPKIHLKSKFALFQTSSILFNFI